MIARSSPAPATRLTQAQASVGHTALWLVLGGRALINALFALWLWNANPGWSAFFGGAATYLAADGIFALLATGILSFGILGEAPRLLTTATAADGLLRILAAVALWAFPGLPDFPVTAVAFFGIVGSCAVYLATAAITIRFAAWRSRHRAHEGMPLAVHEELDPLLIVAVVVIVLVGYAFLAGPPVTAADYRALGIRWASVLTVAFAVAAFGVAFSAKAPHR